MKKVEAVICRLKLEEVKDALVKLGIAEMAISEVSGFHRYTETARIFRGVEYGVGFVPKIKIEMVFPDALAAQAVVLLANADSGRGGHPTVVVIPIEDAPVASRLARAFAA